MDIINSEFNRVEKSGNLLDIIRLFLSCSYASFCSAILFLFSVRGKAKKKYYCSICSVFKDESPFLKEWIEYHLLVGVGHFYLYNNNSSDCFFDVLAPYIENGVVTLHDWSKSYAQMEAVEQCYEMYKEESSWILHIDLDEFLYLKPKVDIIDWLNKFEKFPCVIIYWKHFGSNGLIYHDYTLPVIEQYTMCESKLQNRGKFFINTNYIFKHFDSPHMIKADIKVLFLRFKIPPVNPCVKFISYSCNRTNRNLYDVQLNHYWSKSFDIFLKNKVERTDGCNQMYEKNRKIENVFISDAKCIAKDFSIQRFLLKLKLKLDENNK